MISGGALYDWAEEARRATTTKDRLREMCVELIDNTHRLSNLIEEMAAFRSTKQHDAMMAELKGIQARVNQAKKGGA